MFKGMFKYATATLVTVIAGVLLTAGPVAADDRFRCTRHTIRPGWSPNWPILDALGVRDLLERSSGTATLCVGNRVSRNWWDGESDFLTSSGR